MKNIVVVGAGICGLMISDRLSSLGYKVTIVEMSDKLASGPSSRNGGYVHGGAFHAGVIDDDRAAYATAVKCKEGNIRIRNEFPFACQNWSKPIHLLVRSPNLSVRAQVRWQDMDIYAKPISRKKLQELFPLVDDSKVNLAVEVRDTAINYPIVYKFLLERLKSRGVVILANSTYDRQSRVAVSTSGGKVHLDESIVVYCTGANSKQLFDDRADEFRIWKSHVVSTPLIEETGFMFIDPGEVSVIPQGKYCVVCQSQEDTVVTDSNYDILDDKVEGICDALEDVMPSFSSIRSAARPNACLKPSVITQHTDKRNRDIYLKWHSETELVALPGKATLAPLIADQVANTLYAASFFPEISTRPGDGHTWPIFQV